MANSLRCLTCSTCLPEIPYLECQLKCHVPCPQWSAWIWRPCRGFWVWDKGTIADEPQFTWEQRKKTPFKFRSPLQTQEIMLAAPRDSSEGANPALGKKGNSKLACSFFILAWQKEKETKAGQTPCKHNPSHRARTLTTAGRWFH